MKIWDLDQNKKYSNEYKKFFDQEKYKFKTDKFKIGDIIQFWTGYNDDIRAQASIKGIDKDGDLYVFTDCYWCPIKDDTVRKIKIINKK